MAHHSLGGLEHEARRGITITTSAAPRPSLAIFGVLDLTGATVLGLTSQAINAQTLQGNVTIWHAQLHALVDQPSGAASVVQIMVKTGTSADTVTVKRGSTCLVNFQ